MNLEAGVHSSKLHISCFCVELRYDEDERNLYFVFSTGKRKLRFQFYVPYGYPDDASPDERPLLMQEEGLYDVQLQYYFFSFYFFILSYLFIYFELLFIIYSCYLFVCVLWAVAGAGGSGQ
jgi:hypothetical protein